ncbi:hypothetical protein OSTOST_19736, partial [Ostertagia ostertagi]
MTIIPVSNCYELCISQEVTVDDMAGRSMPFSDMAAEAPRNDNMGGCATGIRWFDHEDGRRTGQRISS